MQLEFAQTAARELLESMKNGLALEGAAAGSLALGCHGVLSREIRDIDIVSESPSNDVRLVAWLRDAGYELEGSIKAAKESVARGKLRFFRGDPNTGTSIKFELFVPARFKHPSCQAKALCNETYRSIGPCPAKSGLRVVSAEICLVWKLLFGRPSDEQDIVEARDLANERGILLKTELIEKHVAAVAGATGHKMDLLRRVFFNEAWYSNTSGVTGCPESYSINQIGRS